MECTKVLSFLSSYNDGELKPQLRSAIESHLKGCVSCEMELQLIRKMDQAILESFDSEISEESVQWIMEKVKEDSNRNFTVRLAPILAGAFSFLLFFIGGFFLNNGEMVSRDLIDNDPTAFFEEYKPEVTAVSDISAALFEENLN